MLTAERGKRFRRDGFHLGPRVLSEDAVAALQEETRGVIADREEASKPQPMRRHTMNGDPERPVWPIGDIFRASPAWHGSGPNRSGRIRRASALPMMTERTRLAAGEAAHVLAPPMEPGAVGQGELFSRVWPRSA